MKQDPNVTIRLRSAGDELRKLDEARFGTEQRQMSDEDAIELAACRSCRAICSAALNYGYDVQNVVTDPIWAALRDCYICCDVHVSLMYRESLLEEQSAELAAMACDACIAVCTGSPDPMMKAVVDSCTQAAVACRAPEEGENSLSPAEQRSLPEGEQRAVKFLVTESDGTTHLPYTGADGKPNHTLMGAAWAALHGGYRGKKYAGPNKAEATTKLKSVYKSEKMDTPEETNSLGDEALEVRSFKAELRAETGKPSKITGMPIVFNSPSQMLSESGKRFIEVVSPDAVEFEDDLKADSEHDPARILGRSANKTLVVTKTAEGYRMDVTPPETTWARDLMTSIGRGDVDGGSFAFRVKPGGEEWSTEADGTRKRQLTAITVRRVTVTSNPAYTGTYGFQVRSLDDILGGCPATAGAADPKLAERSAEIPIGQSTPGQAAPPAQCGAVGRSSLRRHLELAERA